MVTQREMNNLKRHLNSSINDANELPQESKSKEVTEINIGILSACKESIEEQLTNYEKQRNEQIDSLEENKENDKNIKKYENVADTGKKSNE